MRPRLSLGSLDWEVLVSAVQTKLNFIQNVWEKKVKEGCNQSRFCRRNSFCFRGHPDGCHKHVVSGWRGRMAALGGRTNIHANIVVMQ